MTRPDDLAHRMAFSLSRLQILLLLVVAAALIVSHLDSMWSQSVDLAHHYALVARLTEHWVLPAANDPSLGEMNVYPRMTHLLAAFLGSLFDSPIIGIQLVTLGSIILFWGSAAFILVSAPRRAAFTTAAVFTIMLILNRLVVRLELNGDEVVGPFFLPQLAAQAVAMLVIAACLYLERCGVGRLPRYLMVAVSAYIVTGVHLLPALELLAFLFGLVVFEWWARLGDRSESMVKQLFISFVPVAATSIAIWLHPASRAMAAISGNNGILPLRYVSGPLGVALLCIVVAVLSGTIVVAAGKLDRWAHTSALLAVKYVGIYGLAVGGVCLAQIVALYFGYGSEYAVRKYVFGLNTALLVEIPLLPSLFMRPKSVPITETADALRSTLLLALLIIVSFLAIVSEPKVIDTSDLVALEKQVQLLRQTQIPSSPGKYDYVVNVAGMPSTIAYMLSIGTLKAPRTANAEDVLFGRTFRELGAVGTILTTANRSPYDIPACRRLVLASSLVLLDGSCVSKISARHLNCVHTFEFSNEGWIDPQMLAGFSGPEVHGRWTDGERATFTCRLAADIARPETVRIKTVGFVVNGRSQRLRIAINNQPAAEYRYAANGEQKTFELPLHLRDTDQVRIEFFLPDAVAPKDLGMSDDPRKNGIGVRAIEFN